jgi:hypothetical protein
VWNVGETGHHHPGAALCFAGKAGRRKSYMGHVCRKWFYNTSSGTAIRAAHKSSLIEGTKSLDAQDVRYEGTRWTRVFMWFRSLERNTLRPQKNESCIVVCVVPL